MDPLLTLALIAPSFFALGAAMQWLFARFRVSPLNSLLVTFGFTVIVEAVIQSIWTADFRRLESGYADDRFRIGTLFVPLPELLTLVIAIALSLARLGGAALHRPRARDARGGRGSARRRARSASTSGGSRTLVSGAAAALAGAAGLCLALSHTLAPSQIYAWIGVVFAAVMMGGPGRALGPLVAGIVIGVSEAVTMAVTAPSWAPLVSFSLLILLLLLRPGKA